MNCDPIARWYRWLEYAGFGGALQRRRFAFLGEIAGAKRVLLLGDGDGRFLARFSGDNPSAAIDSVDLSGRMLELARSRCPADQVTFHRADALKFPIGGYDLICTHFFLDCLNRAQLESLADRIAASCARDARWVVSEFREPGAWAHAIVSGLYFFFRWTTGLRTRELVDHRPILERAGFQMKRCESARFGLLVSELWIKAGDISSGTRES